MFFVALKMLTGDRAKYFGLIFAIAFSTFLLEQQSSIFAGILKRTTSQVIDVVDAKIWVMDPKTQYVEEIKALRDTELTRVRSVPGVAWGVPLYRGLPRAKGPDGTFRSVIMLGLDDASLVGAPRKVLMGSYADLRQPDSAVIDRAGFFAFFPGEKMQLGKTLELNDRLVRIVGIVEASAPFQTFPIMYARYSQALNFTGRERNQMSFVLVEPRPGVDAGELCKTIEQQTGLVAKTTPQFAWQTIHYYLTHTGIPVNFGITITIAIIVGTVVAGQTFYIFTLENLKQFGALKAIGVTNRQLIGMILLQALTVGAIGFSLGSGMGATFFLITLQNIPTRGIVLLWQNFLGTAAVIFLVVIIASLISIRRVLVLEPAAVFRT